MKKSCVLVSGGAGHIVSHTTVELINVGARDLAHALDGVHVAVR